MDTLITILVFVALSALSTWLGKKNQPEGTEPELDESPPPRPRTRVPPQPGAPASPPPLSRPARPPWEEQLRRMLEQMQGPSPTSRPMQERPLPGPEPPPLFAPEPEPEPISRRAPAPPVPPPRVPLELKKSPMPGPVALPVVQHAQATLPGRPALALMHSGIEKLSPEIQAARRLIQKPETVRQAIILQAILGPCRALEP